MSWARLDDRANEHRKQLAAGPEACWLWACGLMYANRQEARDGFIPELVLRMLYPFKRPTELAKRLVEVGLWEPVEGGWRIYAYHEWNMSKEQVATEREQARERMRRVRANRKRTDDEPDANERRSSGSTPLQAKPDQKAPSGPKRSRRVPEDWTPKPEHVNLAMQLGAPLELEAQKFRDHEFASAKSSWDSTFCNWLRKSIELRRSAIVERQGDRAADGLQRQLARVNALKTLEGKALP